MHHKWQLYEVWFLRYRAQQTEFLWIWIIFLPFYLTNNPKNQKFKKMKKVLGDIIILHKCLKNHDHMPYCPWNMACDGWNLFFILGYYYPNIPKNQNFLKMKKKKNNLRYHYFTHCTKNFDHMMYCFWDIVHHRQTDGQMDRFFKNPQNIFQ